MKKKIILILALVLVMLFVVGCKKKPKVREAVKPPITLNYYNVFENEENLKSLFAKFRQVNPHVNIVYRNFNDLDRYLETVLSELAEGGGPDIVNVPSSWVAQNYKKLVPAEAGVASPAVMKQAFVDVVSQDNVLMDVDGEEKVFGVPLYVDSLAIYYNNSLFQQFVPEIGRPSSDWQSLKVIADRISMPDSDGKLVRSGVALGSGSSISRSVDVLLALMLQHKVNFYNNNFSQVVFASQSPAMKVIEYLYSFYNNNWQDHLASEKEKDLYAFVTGKTAMIFGYAYSYDEILSVWELAKRNGEQVIDKKDILTAPLPQVSEVPVNLAHYFSQVVTRNSQHSAEAWKLITFMADPANLEEYYKKRFRPTSRRELIVKQQNDKLFGVFASQIGTAVSVPMVNQGLFYEVLRDSLDELATADNFLMRSILLKAQNELNKQIGLEGAFPPARNK